MLAGRIEVRVFTGLEKIRIGEERNIAKALSVDAMLLRTCVLTVGLVTTIRFVLLSIGRQSKSVYLSTNLRIHDFMVRVDISKHTA